MNNRNFNSPNYRYGFNGKEKDDEVKGAGNQLDYGMRVYDPRLGKFFSVDPMFRQYPELTSYQFSSNSPILNDDLDGLEANRKNTASRRNRPLTSNKFNGGGLVSFFGGSRGKYFRNHNLEFGKPSSPPSAAAGKNPEGKKDEDGTHTETKEVTTTKPISFERTTPEGNPDHVEYVPSHNEGTASYSYDVKDGKDDKGNPATGSFEIGVIDKDGKVIQSTNIDGATGSGELKLDYKLNPGEKIYTKHSFTRSSDDPGATAEGSGGTTLKGTYEKTTKKTVTVKDKDAAKDKE